MYLRRKWSGLKPAAEAMESEVLRDLWLVEERCVRSEAGSVSLRGAHGSENPGMSSDKRGENPRRRKPKVS